MDDLTLLMEVSRKVIVPDAYDTFRSDEEALAEQGIEFEEVANHFSGCATRYTKEHADRRDLEVLYELHLTPKSEKHLLAQRISKPEIEKALRSIWSPRCTSTAMPARWIGSKKKLSRSS
jgi:hypothetical protein